MLGVTPNKDSPILAPFFRLCVLGRSNTGKTEVTLNLVSNLYFNEYHRIIVIAPNWENDDYMKAFIKKCNKENKPITCTSKYSGSIIKKIEEQIEAEEGKFRTLLIIDDPIGQSGLSDKISQASPFNKFVAGIKFKKCSLIFITQSFSAASTALRANLDGIIILKNLQQKQLKAAADEFALTSFKEFSWLYLHCTRVLNSKFLMIKVQGDYYEMYHGSIGVGGKIEQLTQKDILKILEKYKNLKKENKTSKLFM